MIMRRNDGRLISNIMLRVRIVSFKHLFNEVS